MNFIDVIIYIVLPLLIYAPIAIIISHWLIKNWNNQEWIWTKKERTNISKYDNGNKKRDL